MVANPALLDQVRVSEVMSRKMTVIGALAAVADTVELPLDGFNGGVFAWSGTFSGVSLVFEASYDDKASWVSITTAVASGDILGLNLWYI